MKKRNYELESAEQKVENGVLDHVDNPTEDEKELEVDEEKVELRRELGLFGGISFIVGCIVGTCVSLQWEKHILQCIDEL